MKPSLALVLLLPLLFAGCGGKTIVVLRNPKTGEMAQCQSDRPGSLVAMAAVADCAKAYQAAGWERMN